jgi:hypothetical protein
MKKTTMCPVCASLVSLSNIGKHINSKLCLSGGKQKHNPSKICRFCQKQFFSASGRGVHEVQCEKNLQRRSIQEGRTAWNKGMRSKPDLRNPKLIGKHGGYRPNSGRSKKFRVFDSEGNTVVLQSTYEYALFEILCELNVRWVRPKALKYNNKNYFADFYLPDFNVWLDPKNNYKAKVDKEKIDLVIKQNKCKLFVVLEKDINKEYIARII